MAESNEITLQVVSASTDKFLENTRKRIIKAYLSVIIMTRIDEASITTPTDIISMRGVHKWLKMVLSLLLHIYACYGLV